MFFVNVNRKKPNSEEKFYYMIAVVYFSNSSCKGNISRAQLYSVAVGYVAYRLLRHYYNAGSDPPVVKERTISKLNVKETDVKRQTLVTTQSMRVIGM